MTEGFSVHLDALDAAVAGNNGTLDEVHAHDVQAITCDPAACGRDRARHRREARSAWLPAMVGFQDWSKFGAPAWREREC